MFHPVILILCRAQFLIKMNTILAVHSFFDLFSKLVLNVKLNIVRIRCERAHHLNTDGPLPHFFRAVVRFWRVRCLKTGRYIRAFQFLEFVVQAPWIPETCAMQAQIRRSSISADRRSSRVDLKSIRPKELGRLCLRIDAYWPERKSLVASSFSQIS